MEEELTLSKFSCFVPMTFACACFEDVDYISDSGFSIKGVCHTIP
jgi:hypothetical protein